MEEKDDLRRSMPSVAPRTFAGFFKSIRRNSGSLSPRATGSSGGGADSDSEMKKSKGKKKKKALVLDLDETLIHTTSEKIKFNSFKTLKHVPVNTDGDHFYAYERPNVRDFLEIVCDMFEVYIFTAAKDSYAKQIIDSLCKQIPEDNRRYRDSCDVRYDKLCKDLYMFDRDLKDILIVDDNEDNAFFFPKNAIIIPPFEGNPDDDFLMEELLPVLKKCEKVKDVRKVVKSKKAKKLIKYDPTIYDE